MKVQYAMVVDSSKCFNCRACVVACQFANDVPSGSTRNWVKNDTEMSDLKLYFQPGSCMHCESPTCVQACPTGATYKDKKDGTVKIDKGLCIRCGSCVPYCPYGARYLHPDKMAVDKCNFCEELRSQGMEPACVEVCPTRTRTFGNILDKKSDAARLLDNNKSVKVINSKVDTLPNFYYLTETAPSDWPVEPKDPAPIQLWKNIGGLFIKVIVGLNFLGVLAMFGKQVIIKDEPPESDHEHGTEDANG